MIYSDCKFRQLRKYPKLCDHPGDQSIRCGWDQLHLHILSRNIHFVTNQIRSFLQCSLFLSLGNPQQAADPRRTSMHVQENTRHRLPQGATLTAQATHIPHIRQKFDSEQQTWQIILIIEKWSLQTTWISISPPVWDAHSAPNHKPFMFSNQTPWNKAFDDIPSARWKLNHCLCHTF